MQEVLGQTFLGNTIEHYYWFAGIVVAGIVLKRLLSRGISSFVYRVIKKYSSGLGNNHLFNLLKKPVELLVLIITFYFAFDWLDFPVEWHLAPKEHFGVRMVIRRFFLTSLALALTWIVLRLIDFWALTFTHKAIREGNGNHSQLIPFMKEVIKVIVVIFSLFFMLGTIYHLNITSLIAGLGIGGLAVALAAKESIENLLGSFTIFFDKPFTIGDTIKADSIEGTVERIGFRSTRIRTGEKSFVTVPNKKLVDEVLDNLSLRTERRVSFSISLSYNTSPDNIKKIIADIEKGINEYSTTNHLATRVTLYNLGLTAINIHVLYFVTGNDNDIYLKTRQDVNMKIIEIVTGYGVQFAVEKIQTSTN